MKHFLLSNATKAVTIAGVILLIVSAAIWYQGNEDSRYVQVMAESLGKAYAGGGWYPANGTDYDLEACVVGYEGWVTRAINVERSDQIEVRLRVASSDKISTDWTLLTANYSDAELADITEKVDGLRVFRVYDSPDAKHVAYIPVGTYTIEDSIWSRETGAYTLGVSYDGADEPVYREILIVPPDSEIEFSAVLGFAVAGVVCLFILAPITSYIYYRYEKKCYAWK